MVVKRFYPFSSNFIKVLSYVKYRCYSTEKVDFPERSVLIQTCGQLYTKWKKEKMFKKLPDSNLTFEVKYTDTQPDCLNEANDSVTTVLALHGAPGSWRDFKLLSSYLHQRGCRVIAPCFPDFHVCKPGIFRHSHLEKAQYIKDFLAAISVSHVDLLVCHSSSIYPGLNLCLDDEPKIKSLALLNAGTFNIKEMSGTKHLSVLNLIAKVTENPIGLKFAENYGPLILKKILRVPVRFENILDPVLSATTMLRADIVESRKKFLLVSRKLPILYIFSENDPLVYSKSSYELSELFGACASDVFIYNNQGSLIQKGTATPTLKVLVFQEGSHYAFLKFPEIVNREIFEFLELCK